MKLYKRKCLPVFAALLFILLLVATVRSPQEAYAGSEAQIILYSAESNHPLNLLIPSDATASEKGAAKLLADYIKRITGYRPEIVPSEPEQVADEGNIFLRLVPIEGAPFGSYVLRAGKNADQTSSPDKNVYIEGCDARGLYNGVYAYLKNFCGVNIYSAWVETVPESSSVIVDDGYYLFYKPLLEYADTDWISPHDADFAVANGLNGSYSPIEKTQGGRVNYITFCHTLSTAIVPADELFSSHPEYFAYTEKGKREPTQLCLSHPDVIARAKEDVLQLIEEEYDEDSCLNIISVTQADNQTYCRCKNCSALAEKFGGQSGLMIWFVNQIAEAVEESDYSDVVVDTFAYQYTRKAPVGIRPKENVCVRLCTIECCFGHTLDNPSCEKNADFMKDLNDWAQICDRLYIWDYTTNYAQTIGLFPDFGVIQKNIAVFVQNSVVGIYEEGAYYAAACNTEYADLRAYLLSRYMYDPLGTYGTTEEIREGFLKAYYGEGAEEIKRFLDYITAHAGDDEGHLYIYVSMEETLHGVTDEDVVMLDKLWTDAEEKASAAGDEDVLYRIQRSRLSWEYYKSCTGKGAYNKADPSQNVVAANKALIEGLKRFRVTQYCEGRMMDSLYLSPYLSPARWSDKTNLSLTIVCGITGGLVIAAAVFLIAFFIRKKRYVMVLPSIGILLGVILSCLTCLVFVAWEHIWLIIVLTVLTNICFGLSFPGLLSLKRGKELFSSKKTIPEWLIGALIAALPFLLLLTLVGMVGYNGGKPLQSYMIASCWHIAVLLAAQVLTFSDLFPHRKKNNQVDK